MIVSILIFGFFEKLFERKSNPVGGGLMLVTGYVLTTNRCKLKE